MNTWAVPGYTESLELGSGASGRVVLAVHEGTGIAVAVKYLSESLHTRPGFVHDFRAEARLLAGLNSPYVTGLYEYVESPDGAAIVMELVDGVSLRSLLTRQSPLEPEAALVILKGSLLGLADAHRLGVVHRDYKPENVLVTSDGASKLVDFGIAVTTGENAGVAGTPSYMAPEQWTGAPASPAGDVYAATATFFECLTGHKPYPADNLAELALRHVDSPVPADEVPEAVRSLVRRGLAKSPEERPSHAAAFVADLEAAAVAGYGPEWEERGRGRLSALAALLVLLRPRPAPARSPPRTPPAPSCAREPAGAVGGPACGGPLAQACSYRLWPRSWRSFWRMGCRGTTARRPTRRPKRSPRPVHSPEQGRGPPHRPRRSTPPAQPSPRHPPERPAPSRPARRARHPTAPRRLPRPRRKKPRRPAEGRPLPPRRPRLPPRPPRPRSRTSPCPASARQAPPRVRPPSPSPRTAPGRSP